MTDLYHPSLSDRPAWDGRRGFFLAIERRAPEVLASLARDVYPVFRDVVDTTEPKTVKAPTSMTLGRPMAPKTVILSPLDQWRWYRWHLMYHPGCPLLVRAPFHDPLQAWEGKYNLVVGWVGMVACVTLVNWYKAGGPPEALAFDVSGTLRNPLDKPFVEADAEGGLNITMRRAVDFDAEGNLKPGQRRELDLAHIQDEEIRIPLALAEGRPVHAKNERERLRTRELRKRGALAAPKRVARWISTEPAEWLVLWQVLGHSWPQVQEVSQHSDLSALRQAVAAFADSIRLDLRRGAPGHPKKR